MAGLFQNFGHNLRNFGQNLSSFNLFGGRPQGQGFFAGQTPQSYAYRVGASMGAVPRTPNLPSELTVQATPQSLEQQLAAMTGGLQTPPNGSLEPFVDQSGAVTGAPGLLNPRRSEIAQMILGQFKLQPNQFNAADALTNGRLDLTKLPREALANLSPDDVTRLMNSNVLGANLLQYGLNPPTRPAAAAMKPTTRAPSYRRPQPVSRYK